MSSDIGTISILLEKYTARLSGLLKEMDDFIESQALPEAEVIFDKAYAVAIVKLEAEGAKQGTLKEKARARAFHAKMAYLTKKMEWEAMKHKIDACRTIISAKKEQYSVQSEV